MNPSKRIESGRNHDNAGLNLSSRPADFQPIRAVLSGDVSFRENSIDVKQNELRKFDHHSEKKCSPVGHTKYKDGKEKRLPVDESDGGVRL